MIFCIRTLSTFGYNSESSNGMIDCRRRLSPRCIPYVCVPSDWVFWWFFAGLFIWQYESYNGSSSASRSALLFIMPCIGLALIAFFLPMNPVLSRMKDSQYCSCCHDFNTMAQLASTSQAIVQAFHMGFVSDEKKSKPPIVFLADGGHYENSGLLYLMEKVA